MKATVSAALLLTLSLTVPGCLEDALPEDKADEMKETGLDISPAYNMIRQEMADVPCDASVTLTETSANLKLLADSALDEVGGAHSHAEFDLHEDWILDSIYSNKGFTLVDISNPLEPKQLGFVIDSTASLPGRGSTSTLDVKFSHDAKNAFIAYSDSVAVADLSDPADIKIVHTEPNPVGYRAQAHMLYDAKIGDDEYLFVFPSVSGEHIAVHKFTGSGPSGKLEFVRLYTFVNPMDPAGQPVAPHDGYVTWDPVVEHHLLYIANSIYGIQVINVDDPANPETLTMIEANADGTATGYAPTFYHTVQVAWIDGKRIIVSSAEVGYNTLKVFDATDFTNVKFLGQWVFDEQNPTNMQHNLQIVDGILFEAHYGQGLFGFDLRKFVESPTPEIPLLFHYQPDGGGSYWDVVVRKGLAFISDTPQGLHVIGLGCFTPGDVSLTSDG